MTPGPDVAGRVRDVWEGVLDHRPGLNSRPRDAIEGAVTASTGELLDRLFVRWGCESDDCPATPAWDRALSGVFGRIAREAGAAMRSAFMGVAVRELEAFAEAHPEAAWRPPGG